MQLESRKVALPSSKQESNLPGNTLREFFGGWERSMKERAQLVLLFGLIFLVSSAGFAQSPQSGARAVVPDKSVKTTTVSMIMQTPPAYLVPVQGAPYSLTRQWTSTQTLPDGDQIVSVQVPSRMYRDSLGRTRSEIPLNTKNAAIDTIFVIEIRDHVAGFAYFLDMQNRIAHRYAIRIVPEEMLSMLRSREEQAATGVPSGVLRQPPDPSQPQTAVEKLGLRNIENIDCEQTRTTITYPVGWRGNARPLVSVEDNCTSPYLRMSILMKRVYPPMGELFIRVTDISQINPDPALFQVPPDFSIVDAKDPVTIKYTYPLR
jgi:hypothetical protein